MNIITHAVRPGLRLSLRLLSAGALLSAAFSMPAFADDAAAKLAIGRAQASIDLVSKESPAGARDQSFVRAQQKLVDAQAQLTAGHETEAVWFANEAELLAETSLGAARLISLEQTRQSVRSGVDALQLEIGRN